MIDAARSRLWLVSDSCWRGAVDRRLVTFRTCINMPLMRESARMACVGLLLAWPSPVFEKTSRSGKANSCVVAMIYLRRSSIAILRGHVSVYRSIRLPISYRLSTIDYRLSRPVVYVLVRSRQLAPRPENGPCVDDRFRQRITTGSRDDIKSRFRLCTIVWLITSFTI